MGDIDDLKKDIKEIKLKQKETDDTVKIQARILKILAKVATENAEAIAEAKEWLRGV